MSPFNGTGVWPFDTLVGYAIVAGGFVVLWLFMALLYRLRLLRPVVNLFELLPFAAGAWAGYRAYALGGSWASAAIGAAIVTVVGLILLVPLVLVPVSLYLERKKEHLSDWSLFDAVPRAIRGESHGLGQVDHAWQGIPDASFLTYEEYLQSDSWRERRRYKLAEVGHQCEMCGASGALDVHHRTYERLGREHPHDLMVVCRECHDWLHARGIVG